MDALIDEYERQFNIMSKRLQTLISHRSFRKNKTLRLKVNDLMKNHNIIYAHLIQSMLLKTAILDNLQFIITIANLLNVEISSNYKAKEFDSELPSILDNFADLCNSINMYIRTHYI